jgi:hypothetical protein
MRTVPLCPTRGTATPVGFLPFLGVGQLGHPYTVPVGHLSTEQQQTLGFRPFHRAVGQVGRLGRMGQAGQVGRLGQEEWKI